MMAAARTGDVLLLERLMDPLRSNLPADMAESDDWTPLHEAVASNQLEAAQLLVARGAAVNRSGGIGWTPLHIACRDGYVDITTFLLESGADIYAFSSKVTAKVNALHVAASRGQCDVLALLLDRGVDVNCVDLVGETALMKAAYSAHLDAVQLLVSRGAKTNIRGKKGFCKGKMAWQLARIEGLPEVAEAAGGPTKAQSGCKAWCLKRLGL